MAQISVGTGSGVLLWQTSTGVSPDAAISGQVFQAGTVNDPPAITIVNQDGTNNVYIGETSAVTSSTGMKVAAGGSLSFNPIGNAARYAIATGGTVVVGVDFSQH